MQPIQSFAPIAATDARILILGSMPGEASLRAGQYYAHPQNQFWRIMGELLGFDPAAPYELRVEALKSARIALWDVLHTCHRQGSLDSAIDDGSLVPNDFPEFFRCHAAITRVFFNGAKAETCYRQQVLPFLGSEARTYQRLPSTSPANAAIAYGRKLEAWRAITGSADTR